jgi:hypothetical protein
MAGRVSQLPVSFVSSCHSDFLEFVTARGKSIGDTDAVAAPSAG